MTLHPAAAEGFTANTAAYVNGRPDYPPQVVDWLRGECGLAAGKTALDLGSGTGKFLPSLQATGASVIAVEPLDAMRAQLMANHPGADARAGSAEHVPLADASVDAVTCATCFHWFATEQALAEIRRVLKPGGALGLIWNVRDLSVPWVAALTALTQPYAGDAPRQYSMEWRRLFPAEGFGPLTEQRLPYRHSGSPERVIVDRTLSTSYIAALPPAEQVAVAGQVRALIAETPELAGKAEVTFPYVTAMYCCRKMK
jgi:SAM-dependent methyltransferase